MRINLDSIFRPFIQVLSKMVKLCNALYTSITKMILLISFEHLHVSKLLTILWIASSKTCQTKNTRMKDMLYTFVHTFLLFTVDWVLYCWDFGEMGEYHYYRVNLKFLFDYINSTIKLFK